MWVYFVICGLCLLSYVLDMKLFKFKRKAGEELPGVTTIWDLVKWKVPSYYGLPNYRILEYGLDMFGSVFEYKIGGSHTIAVMDMDLAKKIMSNPDWLNRLPKGHVIYERSFGKALGILFGNDKHWVTSRDFASRTLYNLGFGKGTSMEFCIAIEMDDVVEKLEEIVENKDGEFLPHGFFHVPTLNILWQLIAGSRFSHDDPKLQELLKYFYAWNRSFNLGATPLHAFPWLRHFPGVTEHDAWVQGHQKFHGFFKGIMEERLKEKKFLDTPNDFIDYFLQEMFKDDNNNNNGNCQGEGEGFFNEEHFLTICTDLFMAGADTTSNSLEFAILYLTLHPGVQSKIQEEIDSVIGPNSSPSLVMKNRMTYTEAATSEILRCGCTIPITGRCPMLNSKINSVPVAKDTIIGINIHAIHFSKDLWPDPEAFRPERFLSPEGKIINQHKIMPFGHGKRKCLGETTSRNTFFLFLTAMLQKFSFHLSPTHGPPSLEEICGLSRAPKPYYVRVERRQLF